LANVDAITWALTFPWIVFTFFIAHSKYRGGLKTAIAAKYQEAYRLIVRKLLLIHFSVFFTAFPIVSYFTSILYKTPVLSLSTATILLTGIFVFSVYLYVLSANKAQWMWIHRDLRP
jgi:hypothetical protein